MEMTLNQGLVGNLWKKILKNENRHRELNYGQQSHKA